MVNLERWRGVEYRAESCTRDHSGRFERSSSQLQTLINAAAAPEF